MLGRVRPGGRRRSGWHDGAVVVTTDLVAVVVDAVAPTELAAFWAHALRWEVGDADATTGLLPLVPADATPFDVAFRKVATAKSTRNPIHFDLTSTSLDDQLDSVAELLALGASHCDVGQGPDATHVVLADPEGNELCVIEPGNSFLASCPRLGAVNA